MLEGVFKFQLSIMGMYEENHILEINFKFAISVTGKENVHRKGNLLQNSICLEKKNLSGFSSSFPNMHI